jgi:hypothetical protein
MQHFGYKFFIKKTPNQGLKMTSLQRRTLLTGLPLLALASLSGNLLAQDKLGPCSPKLSKLVRNKASTGGKTHANKQCFPPGTPLNQLNYEAAQDKAVFTDTLDWAPCAYPNGVTITWLVHDIGTAKGSTALWFNGSQINGSNHSLTNARKDAKQSHAFTQRLSPTEAARGRVSLFAQGAAVVEFTVQAN